MIDNINIDAQTTDLLIKSGIELTNLALRGTATLVNNRIKILKSEKEIGKLRSSYDEMINELLIEREQAIRVAQAYKEEYERVNIRDEDIEYLHNTIQKVISILGDFGGVSQETSESFQQMATLLNKDTLKTLGFNYKEAIGQPLTEVCYDTIKSKLGNSSKNKNIKKKK